MPIKKLWSEFPSDRYLCPEWLIEAHVDIQAVINPKTNQVRIFHKENDFSHYCKTDCTKKDICTNECQQKIVKIFSSFPTHSNKK